jgi:HEAT repeat protein
LKECLKSGKQVWKLRAIQALGNLNHPGCGGSLITALSLDRDVLHRAALEALKQLGEQAEPAWQEALDDPNPHSRWQAARGLGELGDPRCAAILAEGLLDENPDVHWPSAEVISALGPAALPAVLEVIGRGKLPGSTRQAAYSALQRLANRDIHELLKPLLKALSTPATSAEAPAAARRALEEWKQPS